MSPKSPATVKSRPARRHNDAKAIGHTPVPIDLLAQIGEQHVADIYAMGVDGDCLEPVIHNKSMVLVTPEMPIRSGDFVTLWPKDPGQRPGIKRVVMAPPENWSSWVSDEVIPLVIVEQLNPPRQYRITTDKLSAIHRVFATFTPGRPEWTVFDEPNQPRRQAGGVR
jgi:hypothetical protein